MLLKFIMGLFLIVTSCMQPINNGAVIPMSGGEINKVTPSTSTIVIVNNDYDLWEAEKKKDLGYSSDTEYECPSVGSCDIDEDIWLNHYPTLDEYIDEYFLPEDKEWALKVAFCESSAKPEDQFSEAVHVKSGATGWFQHLPKFWIERSHRAGFVGFSINHPKANVGVASWLFYEYGGSSHWNSSKSCWQTLND